MIQDTYTDEYNNTTKPKTNFIKAYHIYDKDSIDGVFFFLFVFLSQCVSAWASFCVFLSLSDTHTEILNHTQWHICWYTYLHKKWHNDTQLYTKRYTQDHIHTKNVMAITNKCELLCICGVFYDFYISYGY